MAGNTSPFLLPNTNDPPNTRKVLCTRRGFYPHGTHCFETDTYMITINMRIQAAAFIGCFPKFLWSRDHVYSIFCLSSTGSTVWGTMRLLGHLLVG